VLGAARHGPLKACDRGIGASFGNRVCEIVDTSSLHLAGRTQRSTAHARSDANSGKRIAHRVRNDTSRRRADAAGRDEPSRGRSARCDVSAWIAAGVMSGSKSSKMLDAGRRAATRPAPSITRSLPWI